MDLAVAITLIVSLVFYSAYFTVAIGVEVCACSLCALSPAVPHEPVLLAVGVLPALLQLPLAAFCHHDAMICRWGGKFRPLPIFKLIKVWLNSSIKYG
jgi:hypothetical protein